MQTKPLFLSLAILTLLQLSACGGSHTAEETGTPVTPAPAPTPIPTPAVTFPVQAAAPQLSTINEKGAVFTTSTGLSLYFFIPDAVNSSTCNGITTDAAGSTTDASSCAGVWPPLLAAEGAVASGDMTIIKRASGASQWAYKGYPLYTYINDKSQGDTNGEGLGDVWFLAREDATKTVSINQLSTYVANGLILSATSVSEVLEQKRQNKDGFALYTFDVDPVGASACYGLNGDQCITAWPPLLADKGVKTSYPLSILKLANGQSQWAYKGKPLYLFAGDTAAGETKGDNIGDVWHLATQQPAVFRIVQQVTRLSATGEVLLQSQAGATSGTEIANKDQFTLYTFDADEQLKSNCNSDCAVNWPPFLADDRDAESGEFKKFARDNGLKQWAYKGKPLYFFQGDTEKGQTNGDGVNGSWHLIDMAEASQSAPVAVASSVLGQTLTASGTVSYLTRENGVNTLLQSDKTGVQLYVFDVDTPGQSNCNSDSCINAWPPLIAKENSVATAPFSLIIRADGLKQWALNDQPLYFFAGDSAAGQQSGEALNDVWWVARPAPVRVQVHASKGAMLVAHGQLLPSIGKTASAQKGLTLYTFDSDTAGSGASTCFASCAQTWPPLYAKQEDQALGEFSIIKRTEQDGKATLQWAYKGKPLYFFVSDSQLGDTFGDYPQWPIARP